MDTRGVKAKMSLKVWEFDRRVNIKKRGWVLIIVITSDDTAVSPRERPETMCHLELY